MTKKIVNGVVMDLTAEEIADYQAIREKELADAQTKANEETQKDNLKASAKAKLVAGEALTQEEADTIVL